MSYQHHLPVNDYGPSARFLAKLKSSMTIIIANRRSEPDNLRKQHGEDIEIIDVTSKADEPWVATWPDLAKNCINPGRQKFGESIYDKLDRSRNIK